MNQPSARSRTEGPDAPTTTARKPTCRSKRAALREGVILVTIALVLYYIMLTFVARPYLIPSESMEPTLHGCHGCIGDRIMVDKVGYGSRRPNPAT